MARSRKRTLGIILAVIGGVLVLAFVIATVAIGYMRDRALNVSPSPNITIESATLEERNPVDWDYWLEVNPDIVGWIVVPGTSVDLPVVQGPADDPTYYLWHDVYGEWNCYGCPYVDAGCEDGFKSLSVVIYGHNMSDGASMFTELAGYHDEGFASEHDEVILYTPTDIWHLKVLGSKNIAGWEDVKRTDFEDLVDFAEYRATRMAACDVVIAESEYGFASGVQKQLFTLCTCSYFFNPANERTLVYAERETSDF